MRACQHKLRAKRFCWLVVLRRITGKSVTDRRARVVGSRESTALQHVTYFCRIGYVKTPSRRRRFMSTARPSIAFTGTLSRWMRNVDIPLAQARRCGCGQDDEVGVYYQLSMGSYRSVADLET